MQLIQRLHQLVIHPIYPAFYGLVYVPSDNDDALREVRPFVLIPANLLVNTWRTSALKPKPRHERRRTHAAPMITSADDMIAPKNGTGMVGESSRVISTIVRALSSEERT
jgi:hypothetical protein